MTREDFDGALDKWSAEVCEEAQRLFDRGVPPEACLKIAITIYDSKVIASRQAAIALAPGPIRSLGNWVAAP